MKYNSKIDIKSVIDEVVKHFKNNDKIYDVRPIGIANIPDAIQRLLLNAVWGICIVRLNTQEPVDDPMVVEKAISELMNRGVIVGNVIYKKESFRIQLKNSQYRAFKKISEGIVYSCPWPKENLYAVKTSGKCFADFIEQFDAAIPEIVSNIPDIIEALRKQELKERAKIVEKEFKEKVIRSLIEQYLEPLDLSADYCLKDGDVISMDISMNLSAHLEMPFEQMLQAIKDTDAIHAMLKTHRSIDKDSIIIY